MNENSGAYVYIPVDKEFIKNKQYHAIARGMMDMYSTTLEDGSDIRIISKGALRKILRGGLGMHSRKVTRVIDTYLELGVLQDYDNEYYSIPLIKPFIPVPQKTFQFFLDKKDIYFKVYCILLLKYRLNKSNKNPQPVKFCIGGPNGIVKQCGYSPDSERNKTMFREIIEDLYKNGLIEMSRPQMQKDLLGIIKGYYRNLYKVNLAPSERPRDMVSEEAIKDFIESLGKAFLPTPEQKNIIRNNDKLCGMFLDKCV